MKLEVIRYDFQKTATLGMLMIDGKFECYTLEDTYRGDHAKIQGQTCIPMGCYNVALRPEGGFYQRFLTKYPFVKPGMLHIEHVPNFEYILIHPGNYASNTEGCLLLGQSSLPTKPMIGSSVLAWKPVYLTVSNRIANGEQVHIEYKAVSPDAIKIY